MSVSDKGTSGQGTPANSAGEDAAGQAASGSLASFRPLSPVLTGLVAVAAGFALSFHVLVLGKLLALALHCAYAKI